MINLFYHIWCCIGVLPMRLLALTNSSNIRLCIVMYYIHLDWEMKAVVQLCKTLLSLNYSCAWNIAEIPFTIWEALLYRKILQFLLLFLSRRNHWNIKEISFVILLSFGNYIYCFLHFQWALSQSNPSALRETMVEVLQVNIRTLEDSMRWSEI